MRKAIIENGEVTNIIMADDTSPKWVLDLPDIGDEPIGSKQSGSVFIAPTSNTTSNAAPATKPLANIESAILALIDGDTVSARMAMGNQAPKKGA